MTVHVVGVIGAGVIGTGVTQALAETGHEVILVDICADQLDRARSAIKRQGRLTRLLGKQKGGGLSSEAVDRIRTSTDYGALATADLVIENVTEDWSVKRDVYARLETMCREVTIFAANTSCISISRIASATKRPALVLGMHFMNPVPLKDTVEVIRGYHTSEETLATAQMLLAAMGKQGVVVADAPGFVSNRVLMLMINEAIWVLQDQIASHEQVDRIFTQCIGHRMGPLETADLIGLDTVLLSIEALYDAYRDSKYRACPLLRKMVDVGLLGRKTGRGFYAYEATAGDERKMDRT